jgi:hypothetical protein
VVAENTRTVLAAQALASADFKALGDLMFDVGGVKLGFCSVAYQSMLECAIDAPIACAAKQAAKAATSAAIDPSRFATAATPILSLRAGGGR